jgi:polyribonucleotide 5'-hydroxyl-kinase
MKQLRQNQIREYFFGNGGENVLAPTSLTADISDLSIFRIVEGRSHNTYLRLGIS